jgi:large subunit ribosomal protein L14
LELEEIKKNYLKSIMIQKGTKMRIIDNSGAKRVVCIHVRGKKRRPFASPGSIISITIRSLRDIPRKRVLEGRDKQGGRKTKRSIRVWPALVTSVSKFNVRGVGTVVSGRENTGIILSKRDMLPLANRFTGSVRYEVKQRGHAKASAMARGTI